MDRIAVLIPCYNEAHTIGKVVADFRRTLPEAIVYVYDNNSTDGTHVIAEEAGAVVRHEGRQGKGNVIRRMFLDIDAQCYILVDGDDTYPAEAAREMADKVLHHCADMVVGDRLSSTYYEENKRAFHNAGNALVKKSINFLFHARIQDVMSGYRAFSYRFVKTFPVLSKGFEVETEMSIHAADKNMRVENVAVAYRDRPSGSMSKLNTFRDGLKVFVMIGKMFSTCRPFRFFGIIAAILALTALIFFVPIVVDYMKTGMVPRIPTLIVCGFTAIAAIQSLFSGMIMNILYRKNRQDFEMQLYRVCSEERKAQQRSGLSR